eukprot:CAMPEP_0115130406 /NCGR_PEP_ID=MMETSP0227-20121206/52453_1 /TAXON_ID=89957 /ORGANISM="Polarella glacialis, Strain CCMP 1383" /LENGTH=349 /DNA_ID=CAMNT_0002535631 /DNA_START=109 /DNA_END=1159 /DNA_ORIENTATION=-
MAAMLKRRMTALGDQMASKLAEVTDTSERYKYSFNNTLTKQVRILLEEDAEGVYQAAVREIDDGIPCVGQRLVRQKQLIQDAYDRIANSGKLYQEFTIIPEQLFTVSMRSPIVRCTISICEWNGSMKIVQVKDKLFSSATLAVTIDSRNETAPPRAKQIRADTLEDALRCLGFQVGIPPKVKAEVQEADKATATTLPPPSPTVSTAPMSAKADVSYPTPNPQMIPSTDLAMLFGRSAPLSTPREDRMKQQALKPKLLPGVMQAKPPGSVSSAAPHRASVPDGFLPTHGSVKVWSNGSRQWMAGNLVGLGLGTSANAAAGAVCVQYELAPGQYTQKVLLPEQFRDMLRLP